MNRLYIKVSADKYEFPVAVADSVRELAKMCGVTEHCIFGCLSNTKCHGAKSVYKIVDLGEEEEGDEI